MNAHQMDKAFTLVELVMVIVIIGLLAAVVMPKFVDLKSEAQNAAEVGTVSGVRSGIKITHLSNLAQGSDTYPATLDSAAVGLGSEANPLFTNVIDGGVTDPNWNKEDADTYEFVPTGNKYDNNSTTGALRNSSAGRPGGDRGRDAAADQQPWGCTSAGRFGIPGRRRGIELAHATEPARGGVPTLPALARALPAGCRSEAGGLSGSSVLGPADSQLRRSSCRTARDRSGSWRPRRQSNRPHLHRRPQWRLALPRPAQGRLRQSAHVNTQARWTSAQALPGNGVVPLRPPWQQAHFRGVPQLRGIPAGDDAVRALARAGCAGGARVDTHGAGVGSQTREVPARRGVHLA